VATKKKTLSTSDESAIASSESSSASDVFDVAKVRRLVELMDEFDLSLVDLKQGGQRVRLRRGAEPLLVSAPPSSTPPAPPPPASGAAPVRVAEPSSPVSSKNTVAIKSPMVGTFYASPKPDAPPYVKVGDMISPDTVVCLIEAMKVFNELPAEISGRIIAVVAESGAPVEYGQTLFEIEPK
jgi:acetyl-CoA carboxylase biotin carboxyl carrier protein